MNTNQMDMWHYHLMHSASESVKKILESLEDNNKSAMARRCKLPQPTLSRIANGKVTPSLEVLEIVAIAYGFEVWQLLVHGFDPKSPPVIRYMSAQEEALYRKFKELRIAMSEIDTE